MNPETILIKREQRKLLGACATCVFAIENYHNLGTEACGKGKSTFKKKQCSEFRYNSNWAR